MRLTHPLNLPASGRRQSVYVVFRTWHRPVFLLNSRLGRFSAAPRPSECTSSSQRAILIPRLRNHFAEFLLPGSLERLRLLASPTCVSFSTDTPEAPNRGFSRKALRRLRLRRDSHSPPGFRRGISLAAPLGFSPTFPIVGTPSDLRRPIINASKVARDY